MAVSPRMAPLTHVLRVYLYGIFRARLAEELKRAAYSLRDPEHLNTWADDLAAELLDSVERELR